MKKITVLLAFVALALLTVAGCQNASAPKVTSTPSPVTSVPTTDDHDDNAPRITLADAKKDFDDGKAVFVDTRAEVQYQADRVKGSVNVPMEAFEMRYKSIPTGKKIIAYCS